MTKAETPWDQLAEPFPDSEVKQRPGRGGMTYSYVDARAVMQRFDDVLTPEGWNKMTKPIGEDKAWCRIEVKVGDAWVGREDVGYRNGPDDEEPLKSAVSDAFKRTAVYFGVGRHLYTDHTGAGSLRQAPQAIPAAAEPPPAAAGNSPADGGDDVCPRHGLPWKHITGTNDKGAYDFYACAYDQQVGPGEKANRNGYCGERPPRGWGDDPTPVQPRPAPQESAPADSGEFDDLPFD